MPKLIAKMSKLFVALVIVLEIPTQLHFDQQNYFQIYLLSIYLLTIYLHLYIEIVKFHISILCRFNFL